MADEDRENLVSVELIDDHTEEDGVSEKIETASKTG